MELMRKPHARRGAIVLRVLLWSGAVVLLLLALLLSVYLFYGWRARVGLERKVAALIAAGEPLTLAMLQPPTVDDSINAAADVRAAMALLPGETEAEGRLYDYRDGPAIPLTAEERALLEPYVAERAAALAALRPGLDKPRAVWQMRLTSPMMSVLLPQLNPIRELANSAGNRAYLHYDAGRHDQALEDLRLLEMLSRVAASTPTLVNALVAVGVRGVNISRLIEFAPELKIGDQPAEVPPVQVAEAIHELLDQQMLVEEFRRAMQGERLMQLDTMTNMAGGTFSIAQVAGPRGGGGAQLVGTSGLRTVLARPLIYSNAGYCLEVMNDYITVIGAADLPTTKVQLTPVMTKVNAIQGNPTKMFASLLLPSLDRSYTTHFRFRTEANLAATALAIRWYQTDHSGAFPASLDDLVPKYLPAVPIDYLSGKPIRYRAGDQPIIWSVGENGVDDEGSTAPMNPKRTGLNHNMRWLTKDAVVHLKRQPRPTTQPAE